MKQLFAWIAAAAELEHYLRHHPDSKDAPQIREAIRKFRTP